MNAEIDRPIDQEAAPSVNTILPDQLLALAAHVMAIRGTPQLYQALTDQLVEALSVVDAAVLWLYNAQQGVLQVASVSGIAQGDSHDLVEQIRLRPGEGLTGIALQRGAPIRIDGRARYRELGGPYSQRNQEGLRALMGQLPRDMAAIVLPLRAAGEQVGVLELISQQALGLRDDNLQPLQQFADLLANAIRNARFEVQMQADQRRLETFSAISTAVSSASDLDELVGNTLDVLIGVVNANAGMLLLYNPARSSLSLGAERSLPDAYILHHREIAIADAACAEAVRYGQPISRPLLPEEEPELLAAGLSSCIYLPLLAGGTVAGVACLYAEGRLYERIDTRALMMMSSLVGFAIANVKLYTYSEVERQRLAAVIGGIAEGVALCDGEGRLILANQTAMSLLSIELMPYGQQLSEMPDFYSTRRLDGEPLGVDDLPLARALSGEVFHDYRMLQRGASGRDTVMSFSGGPVNRDDLSQGAVVVFRDVTVSQKVERAKDDFLAVAAHELRSPLAAVRSYTDLLVRREQKRDEDSPDLRGLTILAQQVTHMLRMVDNLLDVSRLDADQVSLQLQHVNLVTLCQQVVEQQRPSAGERALEMNALQPEVTVLCDQLRIRQVLTNLLSNAIRYSANETVIRVSVACEQIGTLVANHLEFANTRPTDASLDGEAEMALIAISDQGVGIAEEQRATLFRRYARGRERRGEGLGLGLFLTKAFVIRHGGTIWVESQSGEGSTFYVVLPLEPPAA